MSFLKLILNHNNGVLPKPPGFTTSDVEIHNVEIPAHACYFLIYLHAVGAP